MNLSTKQKDIVSRLENLIGHSLDAKAIKRQIIAVELPEGERYGHSGLQVLIERVCSKYNLVKSVEAAGVNRLALVLL